MKLTGAIPPGRAALLVLMVAVGAYANSAFNGFAYDDDAIILQHPVVTEGAVVEALTSPYWPDVSGGGGLYRPVTLSSFALEWKLWNGHPAGYHIANIAVHVAVSLLVFLLIFELSATLPALVGAALFAVEQGGCDDVVAVGGEAVAHRPDMPVDAEDLLRDDQPANRGAGRRNAVGAEFVPIDRLEFDRLAHFHAPIPFASTLMAGPQGR